MKEWLAVALLLGGCAQPSPRVAVDPAEAERNLAERNQLLAIDKGCMKTETLAQCEARQRDAFARTQQPDTPEYKEQARLANERSRLANERAQSAAQAEAQCEYEVAASTANERGWINIIVDTANLLSLCRSAHGLR